VLVQFMTRGNPVLFDENVFSAGWIPLAKTLNQFFMYFYVLLRALGNL